MIERKKQLNIIALMRDYPPCTGGIQSSARALHQGLAEKGHSVTVILEKNRGKHIKEDFDNDVRIVKTTFPPLYSRIGGRKYWRFMFSWPSFMAIFKRFGDKRNTIIHGQWIEDGILAGLIGRELKIPAVWTCQHPIAARRFKKYKEEKRFIKSLHVKGVSSLTHIVSIGEFMVPILSSQLGNDNVQVDVIPDGIDSKFFYTKTKEDLSKASLKMIYAGRLVEHKRITDIIKALYVLKQISQNHVHLTILGDGPLREEINQMTTELGLAANVSMQGSVSNVEQSLTSCNIYVSASPEEGQGLAPIEAMTAGLIPVLSDIDAHREILGDPPVGFFFPIGDYEALAKILANLTDDKCRPIIKKAQKRAAEHYTDSLMCERYEKLFLNITSDNS